MILSIHQPNYIPWIGYFQKIARSDKFIFLNNVEFSKGSFTNRNKIKLADGKSHWLTVPILSRDKGAQNISEVIIDNSNNWKKKHIETIKQSYGKAQFFKDIFQMYSEILCRDYHLLQDLNIALIKFLLTQADIKIDIHLASELSIDYENIQKNSLLIAICKHFNTDVYLSGKGARKYNDKSLFNKNGIEIIYQDFTCPVYDQLHDNYLENLSVMDYVFNCGFDRFRRIINE